MEVRNWCYLQKKATHCRFVVLWRSEICAIFRRKQLTVGCFMEVKNLCYLPKKATHCRFVVLWRSKICAIFRRKQLTVGLLFYGGEKLVLSSEESSSLKVCCFMEVKNLCYLQKKATHCRFVVLWRSKISAIFRRKQVTVGCLMEVKN